MVHEIVLFIHDRACTADEQQRIAIVQFPYLVRGQQFFATLSSGKFKKGKRHKRNQSLITLAFFIHVFCLVL